MNIVLSGESEVMMMEFHLITQKNGIITGGISKENKAKETGFIGSLRWWFEVIVRGFDRKACDPTKDKKCIYNGNKNMICPVCDFFGCTGLSRTFRLEITESNDYIVKITSLYPEKTNEIESIFKVLMTFISKYAAFGAKTQSWNGVARIVTNIELTKEDVNIFFDFIKRLPETNNPLGIPNLKDFFFVIFAEKERLYGIRKRIRTILSTEFPETDYENYLMGYARGKNKKASTIFVGNLESKRIWGYIPETKFKKDREKILELIIGNSNIGIEEYIDFRKKDIEVFFRELGGE